jgi:hypothetical protein
MTLPIEIQLPLEKAQITSGEPEQMMEYQRALVRKLEEMYRDMTQEINGDYAEVSPVLKDTGSDTTYGYVSQEGWYLRQGIMVDYWFDVVWDEIETGTPAGNLYVELPYQVFDAEQKPFVGVLQTSTLAYGTGLTTLTINGIPGTFRGEIWGSGSSAATANVTANTAAGQLIGHIRYIGQEIER